MTSRICSGLAPITTSRESLVAIGPTIAGDYPPRTALNCLRFQLWSSGSWPLANASEILWPTTTGRATRLGAGTRTGRDRRVVGWRRGLTERGRAGVGGEAVRAAQRDEHPLHRSRHAGGAGRLFLHGVHRDRSRPLRPLPRYLGSRRRRLADPPPLRLDRLERAFLDHGALGRRRDQHRLPRLVARMRGIGLDIALPVRANVVAGGRIVGNNSDRWRWRGAGARRRGQPRIGARRILGHTLTRQRRVGVTLPVVAVVEWDVLLVAFAQLD